ncbi:MAG TPA: TRZ/ATZ family hydrolase [Steroidobacter sp.]|jgi:5-methylthioadenosine/S-adenosylhomocysteine deaminase|nr:TRZ/ATZ family hydrolase [Steroidobacteraceae bacterium]HLS82063.1 TRZ/ATZ family hydrolase [Steroidobacter sp.]
MEQIDALITARWIIPIEPARRVLEHGALAVQRGRIIAVLPAQEALARYSPQTLIERPTHVLLPGFVNAHTHAAMTLLRGFAEAPHLDCWLREQIWPAERRWIDADYVRDGVDLAIAEMLTGGTTCFADMHLFPEVTAQCAAAARMRVCVGLPVVEAATVWAGSADECLDKGLRLHDEYRGDPLICTALAPYSPRALGDEALARVRRNADELELPMTMHVNESSGEVVCDGERTIARLERLGLLSPLLAAVHMVHLDEDEVERAARAGLSVVHCPQSNLKLGVGVCRAGTLAARGVTVALGTDGAASNNDLDMLDEMRTAALLARGVHPGEPRPDAHDWLQAATLNGARALGLSEVVGSLVEGKWADICCIDLNRAATQPVYDVAAQLVYATSREQVSDVWVAGRALVREGRLAHIDLEEVLRRASRWRERIAAGYQPTE